MPMSLLLMQTALLRHITNTGTISLTLAPVISPREKYRSFSIFAGSAAGWGMFFLPLAFTFLSFTFILEPSHERATKAKLLQLMSGIPTAVYWTAVFLWDFLIYFAICLFMVMVPAFFFSSVFFGKHWDAIGAFLLLLLLYGWASLPLGYIISIFLQRDNRGLSIFMEISILFGLVSQIVMLNIVPLLFMRNSGHFVIFDTYWFFRLFPTFSISWGIMQNFQAAFNNAACDLFTREDLTQCESLSSESYLTLYRCCEDCNSRNCHKTMKHLSWTSNELYSNNGPDALYLGLEGILFFAVLFFLETRIAIGFLNTIKFHLQSMRNRIGRLILRNAPRLDVLRAGNTVADNQVLQEEDRIRNLIQAQQGSDGEALAVLGLSKKRGTFSSANRLTFGVKAEECFGIFGVCGAGKTSTFRMLAGDVVPSEGNAFIHNYALEKHLRKFQSHIGYCPEVDPLMDNLTGTETLLLHGQLRGLRGLELQNRVQELIRGIGLTNCADVITQFYSGGDKRKLSVSIALIGSPPVILLDEPTVGVNPESHRQIWKAIIRTQKRTRAAVLLATQNIKEGEAFCNRLAIMEDCHFHCLESIEQLDSKYGQGYTLNIKISKEHQSNVETVNALKNHIQNNLKNSFLTNDYQGMLQYQVKNPSMTIGHLFNFMSDVTATFEIEDYSIDAISIEQIFRT